MVSSLTHIVLILKAGLRLIQVEAVVAVRHKEIYVKTVRKLAEGGVGEPVCVASAVTVKKVYVLGRTLKIRVVAHGPRDVITQNRSEMYRA